MMTAREFQEIMARCVSIIVFYYNSERTPHSLGMMRLEIQGIAAMILKMSHPDEEPYRVDLPVEGELIARYGHELGTRLYAEFLDSYESLSQSSSPDYVPKVPRPVRRAMNGSWQGLKRSENTTIGSPRSTA